MADKKEKDLKFKLRAGRLVDKEWCFNILRDGNANVYNLLKNKISLEEMSELIYFFFEEMSNVIVDEKLGVEIPQSIGYIQVTGIKQTAYKVGGSSSKLKKAIVQPNYHTDGYVFRSWYKFTNNDNLIKSKVGLFDNAWMYRFKAGKPFKKKLATKIKAGHWKHYARVDNFIEFYPKNEKKL